MKVLTVEHETVYRYHRPVRFGEHRLMFRPRDSHDLRLRETSLRISPPTEIRWMHDVFSNSIAIAHFEAAADTLSFDSRFTIEHYGLDAPAFPILHYAQTLPFSYPADMIPDLARTNERHYPDPDDQLADWARQFLGGGGSVETRSVLEQLNSAIPYRFTYEDRTAPGTRSPTELLDAGRGTCRDYALFMMEAVRSLGLAARFVSGYLYDPAIDGGATTVTGAGATHAWVQVYLPGAGWVEYDPTNGKVGGLNLIRVAVARDPSQAVPLQGTFIGAAEDFQAMEASVRVTAEFEN
ncbi:MAG: transglutaminase family protein [Alphaproteobacteria bacterium]|nr:transglutaminase family protein [Alphaproteobacteria bacterium]